VALRVVDDASSLPVSLECECTRAALFGAFVITTVDDTDVGVFLAAMSANTLPVSRIQVWNDAIASPSLTLAMSSGVVLGVLLLLLLCIWHAERATPYRGSVPYWYKLARTCEAHARGAHGGEAEVSLKGIIVRVLQRFFGMWFLIPLRLIVDHPWVGVLLGRPDGKMRRTHLAVVAFNVRLARSLHTV